MKIKNLIKLAIGITMGISSLSISANDQIKDITFPYGEFKDSDFGNPHINNIFEKYIYDIQKKDIKYNETIEFYNSSYIEKVLKAEKRSRYKDEDEMAEIIYKINFKEKENVNNLAKDFYIEELKIFNSFIVSIKGNKNINTKEKKIILEEVKPLHKAYAAFTENYKNIMKTYNKKCFSKKEFENKSIYSGYNEYCGSLYTDFNRNFSNNLKLFLVYKTNELVTGYRANIYRGDFYKNLEAQIEAIKRNKRLKESQK